MILGTPLGIHACALPAQHGAPDAACARASRGLESSNQLLSNKREVPVGCINNQLSNEINCHDYYDNFRGELEDTIRTSTPNEETVATMRNKKTATARTTTYGEHRTKAT